MTAPKEIERKFLLKNHEWKYCHPINDDHLTQGYLMDDRNTTIRIRSARFAQQGWITIKCNPDGISRDEYEYDIPYDHATNLLNLCTRTLSKVRKTVRDEFGQQWDIDCFGGLNYGLVVAEIELPSKDTMVLLPDWVGMEVSDDPRYFNSSLVNNCVVDPGID